MASNIAIIDIPLFRNGQAVSVERFCINKFSNRKRQPDPKLRYPAVVVKHCVEASKKECPASMNITVTEQKFECVTPQNNNENYTAVLSSYHIGQKKKTKRPVHPMDTTLQRDQNGLLPSEKVEQFQQGFVECLNGKGPTRKYGFDQSGTLFADGPHPDSEWSLHDLPSALLRAVKKDESKCVWANVPGINGYLYFGNRNTVFVMHTEDGDLYSINFLHGGQPKVWYVVAKEDFERVRQIVKAEAIENGYENNVACEGFLRHKQFICTPQFLLTRNVQVYRIVQLPGEYVIVKPGVLHWGFNCGPNVAEATNFALHNHLQELEPIIKDIDTHEQVVQYQFTRCMSGHHDDYLEYFPGQCEIGYKCGVLLTEVPKDFLDFVPLSEVCKKSYGKRKLAPQKKGEHKNKKWTHKKTYIQ